MSFLSFSNASQSEGYPYQRPFDLEFIAKTDYYSIAYSPSKNRFYLVIKGFWKDPEVVPNYIKNWQKALLHASPRFTLLTDLTEAKTYPASIMTIHNEAQELVSRSGLLQVAEIIPDNAFLQFQSDVLSDKSHMPCRCFTSMSAAEEWLDTLK